MEKAADRRRAPRYPLIGRACRVGCGERPLGSATVVDASSTGVLLAFPLQLSAVCVGDLVLVSVLGRPPVHLLGTARRYERGDDARFYLAVELREPHPADLDALLPVGGAVTAA